MKRIRVKICGITRPGDATAAVALGADAIGFVFVQASKRFIEPSAAADISRLLPAFVTRVGLFLDDDVAYVHAALQAIPDLVPQFHGREAADYCEQFGRSYLKALGVASGMPTADELATYAQASGFLYDSHEPGELGGTGHAFDWQQLKKNSDRPLILAGGLHAANVAEAIHTVRPFALDVSSGVESCKGIKDHDKLAAFMSAVHRANA